MNHLVYVTFGEQDGNVYNTQVKELLNNWSLKEDWKITLIQISDSENFHDLSSTVNRIYIKRRFKVLLNFHKKRYAKDIANILEVAPNDSIYFNSRGIFSFLIVTKLLELEKLAYKCNNLDIRGTIEEFRINVIRKCIYPYFKYNFQVALEKASSITTVTTNLRDHLIRDFDIDLTRTIISVNPTLSIMQPNTTLDRRDLAYIGKIAWIDRRKFRAEMIEIIRLFASEKWEVYMIGNSSDTLGLDDEGLKLVPRMTPLELSSYITRFHSGIVLRDNSLINQVAAPCKISDYLCLGMPLIYSGEIGSLKDFLILNPSLSKYIINISDFNKDKDIQEFIRSSYEGLDDIATNARNYFGVTSVIERYIEIFNK